MNMLKMCWLSVFAILLAGTPCLGKESFRCDATEASLRQALEKTRTAFGEKEIVIADGTLYLKSPIELDQRDSLLTLRGSGKTVISGGIPLNFVAVPGKPYWAAKIPEGVSDPQLLAANGVNVPIAVYPLSGSAKYQEKSDLIWLGSQYGGWNRPPRDYEFDRITVPVADLPEFDVADAQFYLLHEWSSSLVRVKSIDRAKGIVYFADLPEFPVGTFGRNSYQIRNIEAGLTPGKWMFHRATREIFYYPKEGENITSVNLTAAVADRLLTITGAAGVTVRNIEFSDCNAGSGAFPSAIEVTSSDQVAFFDITICNCAGNAIAVTGTPLNHSVQIVDSKIYAIDKSGLILQANGDCVVAGCEIHDIGTSGIIGATYRGAKFLIAKNKIHQIGYCGIGFGVISDESGLEYDVAIEDNEISHIMMDESIQDGAGIYVFGAEKFRINRNTISGTPNSGLRHGIYFDEMSHHCTAADNHVSNYFPVFIHKAQNIVFENCRFDFDGTMKFELEDSDEIFLKNCKITAPEIFFNAPENGLKRVDCTVNGKVTEKVTKHNFTFATNEFGSLCCTKLPTEKKARKLPHRIVCLGDSITEAGTFAGELQLYLSCRYPKEKIEVFNAGIGGDTAAGGFRRLERDVLSLKPDMVIVCFGMNDVGRDCYRTRYPANETEAKGRELGFQSYCENMKKIVDTLSGKGIEVVVMAPFPYDEYGTRTAPDDKLEYCNSIGLERLAAHCYDTYSPEYLFPMSRMMLCRLYAWFPELQIAKDRVHPDRRGHWVIANEIAKTVFRDFPAQKPIPFPMTAKMVEFALIGEDMIFAENTHFTPMDTLLANGEIGGQSAELRIKMEALLAAEKAQKQLVYFDEISRIKGLDPADTAKVDPVLDDFAKRWNLVPRLEMYRKARQQRKALQQNAENARKAYFDCLEKLSR